MDQWPRWHSWEQYQTLHLLQREEPSLPQAAQTVGATATSLLSAAVVAGVHLLAFLLLGLLPKNACPPALERAIGATKHAASE